jgi:hypothetical protein
MQSVPEGLQEPRRGEIIIEKHFSKNGLPLQFEEGRGEEKPEKLILSTSSYTQTGKPQTQQRSARQRGFRNSR